MSSVLYRVSFAEAVNIQNRWTNNLWAIWAAHGAALPQGSTRGVLPGAPQVQTGAYKLFLLPEAVHREGDKPGKTPAAQTGMSVGWDAFLSTAVHPHSGSFMCVQSQGKEWLQTRATSRISSHHCLPQEFLRWENFLHCHGTEGPTKFHYPQVFATNCVRTTDCHNLLPTSSHHLYPPTQQGSSALEPVERYLIPLVWKENGKYFNRW